jgi:DNA-binding response OmpR family regulator
MRQKERILCVEDNHDTCELIMIALGLSGFQVTPAYLASEGLRLAEADSFALYVIDGRLPDASGIDLCAKIHRLNSQRPIIFCSALPEKFTLPMAEAAGAKFYLSKPFNIQQLVDTVSELLANRNAERKSAQPSTPPCFTFASQRRRSRG